MVRMSEQLRRRVIVVLGAVVALLLVTSAGTAGADDGGGSGRAESSAATQPVATTEADWRGVARALGQPGELSADGLVYRVTFPRSDLAVTSYDVAINPAFGIFSYAAFSRYPDGTVMMMGDLLTTESEQPRATDILRAGGVELTAVHKHLLAHDPDLWWNHFHDSGSDPVAMATTIRKALDRTGTPPLEPCKNPDKLNLDIPAIDAALGASGVSECGIYRFAFRRNETVTIHNRVLAPDMGVTSVIGFQPTGGGQAAISGDFAMTAGEAQDVIKELRAGEIQIVELHQHSLNDQPRLFYMHFWAIGDAATLAKALGAAVRKHNASAIVG